MFLDGGGLTRGTWKDLRSSNLVFAIDTKTVNFIVVVRRLGYLERVAVERWKKRRGRCREWTTPDVSVTSFNGCSREMSKERG